MLGTRDVKTGTFNCGNPSEEVVGDVCFVAQRGRSGADVYGTLIMTEGIALDCMKSAGYWLCHLRE
ncbi:hypothetical protein GN244_ATG11839 [Phytophthora infestans]|uniref:Uncharacterized protein n=1 Tax=Phytophthora infestans TaxID=4787 RepID=A0A833T915_PHYIN|nr:hypothetical protein GN244_ATG11839 [Phytophthora infestans]